MAPTLDNEVVDEVVDTVDEVDAESNDDDDNDSTETVTVTRTRKTMHPDNVYSFATADEAKAALKAKAIVYQKKNADGGIVKGEPVPNLRVWIVSKDGQVDEEKGEFVSSTAVKFILANNPGMAADKFVESQNLQINLMYPKKRGASGPRKIDPTILMFGTYLQKSEDKKQLIQLFGPDGQYAHYPTKFVVDDDNLEIEWKTVE